MRISDVSTSSSLIGQLQKYNNKEAELSSELTSGKSIDSLQDDSSVANTVLNSQVDRNQLVQYYDNGTNAENIAKSGVNALGSVSSEIDLAIKVAEAGTSDTAVASSVDDIITSVLALGNENYGDDYLFSGTASGSSTKPFTYDSTSGQYVYNGSGDGRSVAVANGDSVTPFASDTDNKAILATLNNLLSLKTSIASGSSTGIATASEALSSDQSVITSAASELSTTQSRITMVQTSLSNKYSVLDDAEETATSADSNSVTASLLTAQNAYSAALQCTQMILSKSLLDYM
jgi:flagellin-like hook-associated protein FlgL